MQYLYVRSRLTVVEHDYMVVGVDLWERGGVVTGHRAEVDSRSGGRHGACTAALITPWQSSHVAAGEYRERERERESGVEVLPRQL